MLSSGTRVHVKVAVAVRDPAFSKLCRKGRLGFKRVNGAGGPDQRACNQAHHAQVCADV
jgi:hypothetical protein